MHKKRHQAGFVNLIGKPNAGKSTLLNVLINKEVAIVTAKPQTTRNRILGITTERDYQIIYRDFPGIIQPKYLLQKRMMQFVKQDLEDAELLLWIVDVRPPYDPYTLLPANVVSKIAIPIYLIINKIDKVTHLELAECARYWEQYKFFKKIIAVSALKRKHLKVLVEAILAELPFHPPFYEKKSYTTQTREVLISEIVRKKIFQLYAQEIPYCSAVEVVSINENEVEVKIVCNIYVERKSQMIIMIGKKGKGLENISILARRELKRKIFGEKKIFLSTQVKVIPQWRKKANYIKRFIPED